MQDVFLLLGAQCSRYSAHVRSYLIKKRIEYVERVPRMWTYNLTIARSFGDASVPVLITPEGERVADSEIILDRLAARFPASTNSTMRIDPGTVAGVSAPATYVFGDLLTLGFGIRPVPG